MTVMKQGTERSSISWGLDVGTYGPLATSKHILALALLAEDAGFNSVWLADHVVFPATIKSDYPYSPTGAFPVPPDDPVMEPVATMGVLIGATQRVRIGTAVLVMPYRNPVVLGKMFATYDQFSGGRVILGAGVGWLEEEFDALATAPFADRGAVTDEYIEVFKRVAAGGKVAFDGVHYQLEPAHAYPGSVQRPHPPVLIGGTSTPALRRVARHGNGWLSVALNGDKLKSRLARLHQLCDEEGRSPDDIELVHKLFIDLEGEQAGVNGQREPGTGTKQRVIDDFKTLADLGYRSFIVRYRGNDSDVQATQLKRFVDEIVPAISA